MELLNVPRREHPSIRDRTSLRSFRKILKNFDPNAQPVPLLILQPCNDSFSEKRLELFEPIKIGRQVGPKSAPTGTNGYFDSKVLSRAHAEIWAENGKVFVKDVKSSNGTFVNNWRLSREGEESEPQELHSGDVIDFGVDILNEDHAVLYQKVSCRVIITEMELPAAPTSSNLPIGVQTGKEPAHAPPPVPERLDEQTMRSFNLESLYGELHADLLKSKEAAANLEQAKAALDGLPNQSDDLKNLEKKLAETTERVTRVSEEYNQVQHALAEFKQVAAVEREKLVEEKNGFRAERDRVAEEASTLKSQMREMLERHSAERKEEETEALEAQLAGLSAQLEKAIAQAREERPASQAEEFQRKEAEWLNKLATFEDRLAVMEKTKVELGVRNEALETQIAVLQQEKAHLEESNSADMAPAIPAEKADSSRKAKDNFRAHGERNGLFDRIFGNGPLSLPMIGISVAVGALGMWAFGLFSPSLASRSVTSAAGRALGSATAGVRTEGGAA